MKKNLNSTYTRMLQGILKKSWRQHPIKQQLYGHLPTHQKTIEVRRPRRVGSFWKSRDERIRDVHLWTPSHGRVKAGGPSRTYTQQRCADTGGNPEDLPGAMDDRGGCRERVFICIYKHTSIYVYVHKNLYLYIYINIYMYTHTHTHTYIYIYNCMYTYIYTYVHIHMRAPLVV